MKSESVITVGELMRSVGIKETTLARSDQFIKDHKLKVLFTQPRGMGRFSKFIGIEQAADVRKKLQGELSAIAEATTTNEDLLSLSRQALAEAKKARDEVRAIKYLIKEELMQFKAAAEFFNKTVASIAADVQSLHKELANLNKEPS